MFLSQTLTRVILGKGGTGSGGSRAVLLDNNTVPDTSTPGSVVGNLTVVGGTGGYFFSLPSNPGGVFAISGNQLVTAGSVVAGNYPITVRASHGGQDNIDQVFTITVSASGGGTGDDDWAAEVAAAG